MTSQAQYTSKDPPAKFTKLIIHKFPDFRHSELNFDDVLTLINGAKHPAEVLANFIKSFKFLLSFDEASVEDVTLLSGDGDANDPTYVEAHFYKQIGDNDEISILRKTLADNNDIIYTLNDNPVSLNEFRDKLKDLGFEYTSTFIIDAQMINRIAIMSPESRGAFIEKLCSTPDFVFNYQRLKSKIENIQEQMKKLVEFNKELKNEEKSEKAKVGNIKKFGDALRELNKTNEEFLLFELYHNNRINALAPQKLKKLQDELKASRKAYNEILTSNNRLIDEFFNDERMSLEANMQLRELLIKKGELDREMQSLKQEKKFLEMQSQNDFGEMYSSTFQNQIDKHKKSLEDLVKLKDVIDKSHDEYLILKKEFLKENLKAFVPFNTMKRLIFDEIQEVQDSADFFESQINLIGEDIKSCKDKCKHTEDKMKEIQKEIDATKEEGKKLRGLIDRKKREVAKYESIASLFRNKVKKDNQTILEKLRKKFSYSIIGRLCDLFDVVTVNGIEPKVYHILQRLGKYSEAIIVDSQEVADKCVQFLKLQNFQQINEVIVPITNYVEVSTEDEIKNFEIPADLKAEPIEKFIQAKHPEIQKLIIHLLKPTIVTDFVANLELIADATNNSIIVTSFDGHLTRKPNGVLETHPRFLVEAEFPDETLMELKEKLQVARVEAIEFDGQMSENNLKFAGLTQKFELYRNYYATLTSFIESNKKSVAKLKTIIDRANEALKKFENIKGMEDMKKKFKELKEIIRPSEKVYFEKFLVANGYKSVEDYEKAAFKVKNCEKQRQFYASRIEMIENVKQKIISARKLANPKQLKSVKKQLNQLEKALEQLKEELEESRKQNNDMSINVKESYKKALEKRSEFYEAEKKVEQLQQQWCDEMIDVQIALAESFQLLFNALVDCDNVPLRDGSLANLLDIHDISYVNADYSFIEHGLERVDINFDRLDAKLKAEEDVPKKRNDMIKKLRQLKTFLDEFALDVTGDEQHLSAVSMQLHKLVKETRKLTEENQNVMEEFQEICQQRVERFKKCLQTINKEIREFCEKALGNNFKGILKVVDDAEPCNHGVDFIWRDEAENLEYSIGIFNRKYEAAFAFVMGLLKHKDQRFFILNDAAKATLKGVDQKSFIEYLKADEKLQIIALMTGQSLSVDEHCNYTITMRQGLYNVQKNM